MDDLIAEFLTETNESLEELDVDLVKLEQDPNDKDLLSKIFRVIHTVKGTCGFIGLSRLESVAHKAEDVLGLFRDGALEVTPEYVSLIFESLDRIKYIVGEIEATGEEPKGDDSELINKLASVLEDGGVETTSNEELAAAFAIPELDGDNDEDVIEAPVKKTEAAIGEEPQKARESAIANQSLRVNVDVLENLMTLVSELVLTRNQLLQIMRSSNDDAFTAPLQRLNHVVSDLQEGVMKTRMQPVGNAWSKLPRIIRDICNELHKKIELDMKGQDTELDRQVLELIKDPLTHMVRNSADHGIESPAERAAAGKPETGHIRLNSYHEGGHIIIEIADDGRGLSTDKIKAKILKNNMATAEEIENLSDQQLQQFIFKPGFSTAETITSVSGRGVGMDVVRTNIEKIGGSIDLKSVEGQGTTIQIKIPLTLAIVSALIVESGSERFAIPQLAVKELVMTSIDGENRIETIKGTPVFRLRDTLLPLVSLQELLKIVTPHSPSAAVEDEQVKEPTNNYNGKYIVVTQVGSYMFGVIVDKVFDTEEIVVKPVANMLRNIDMFSGNTILGDGTVIMILDPSGIAKSTGDIDMAERNDNEAAQRAESRAQEKTSLLLFRAGAGAPKAVPLELVSRLEEIKAADVEYANDKMVVQYRGNLMPLLPYDNSITFENVAMRPVLVFSDGSKSMGLVVDSIIDITEHHLDIKITSANDKMLGSAIIHGKTTDIVNVSYFLQHIDSGWYNSRTKKTLNSNGHIDDTKRVLLVEDSPFFRNMLTPLLKVAGYDVTTTGSAAEALELCDQEHQFDIILSDIEMPEMSGIEFAEELRRQDKWQNIPLVALSSHTSQHDVNKGIQAGFHSYIAKFDRDSLLDTLSETFSEARKDYGEAS